MRHDKKVLILAFLLFASSAAVWSQATGNTPAANPASATKAAPAAEAAAFDPALLQPAALRAKAPDVYEVKFTTTAGDFTLKVTRAWAPLGADRFYNLVQHHFYDGATFFRVLPNFMAQFGLSPYPQVSRAWTNANLKDDPVMQSNHRGFISFAMAGPNTRTTQVFISTGNNERLDSDGFAPFGMVTDGMKVVDKLYNGYGEGAPEGHGPDQGVIEARGRAYLDQGFPKLDSIKTAVVVSPAAK